MPSTDVHPSPLKSTSLSGTTRSDPDQLLMTKAEVAALLRVTPHTVRRWAREGRIHQVKLGERTARYTTQSVLEFIVSSNASNPGSASNEIEANDG
jgi:excisionase family DNA binding protein